MSITYKKISELDAAGALTGSELLEVSQSSQSKKETLNNLSSYIENNIVISSPMIRNDARNPLLNIWQRDNTSITSPATNEYTADGWKAIKNGTMDFDIIKDTVLPHSRLNYSLKFDVTTAQGSMGAGDYAGILQPIEGYDFLKYVGRTATFGMNIRSTNKSGVATISFRSSTFDRSYLHEITLTAGVWVPVSFTIPLDYSGGTWDYENGIGIQFSICFAAGSTFTSSATDSWINGSYLAGPNQDNFCDSTSNAIHIADICFNRGDSLVGQDGYSIEHDISSCQRYYEKSYDLDVNPGTATFLGVHWILVDAAPSDLANSAYYRTLKRTSAPTVTTYDTAGNSGKIRKNSVDNIVPTSVVSYNNSNRVRYTGAGTIEMLWHWTADADL